jgi:uroporphyrinogen-III synthase
VFSSSSGVALTVERLRALDSGIERLATRQIAVIGPATAREAERLGLTVRYRPDAYVAEALAAGLPAQPGERVLLALAAAARSALWEGLTQRGIVAEQVAVYDTIPGEGDIATLSTVLQDGVAAATFASSLTVQHFSDLTRHAGYTGPGEALAGAVVACIGPVTAAAAAEAGLRVDVVAAEHTIPALVAALRQHFAPARGDA